MAVFRVERNSGYTVMSNHHLRNKELTLKAKGLLSQMLSLPEDWDYTLAGLSHINRESIDAIRTAVWELEKAGYILRRQGRDEKGKLTAIEYTIYEQPQPVLENPIPGKPMLENPTTDNPTSENPTQLNKDRLSTNLSKKEKSITDPSNTDSFAMQQTDQTKKQQKRIPQITTRLEQIDKVLNKLYEDNALGTIPQDRYEQMSQKYSEEYYALKAELLRYSFFYSGDNDYRNSSVSFCNAAPLLISDFFSAPLAKQKETRYNMTERTESVIFKEARAWLLPITRLSSSARHC